MKKAKFCAIALIVSAALTTTSVFGQAPVPPLQLPPPRDLPSAEENPELVPSNASESPEATGTTLSPPVTITYKGNSTALGITDSGSGSGLSSTLSNRSDNGSAVFGGTVGGGAGITGIASGPTGFGGVFEITDSSNGAAAVSAISSGTGSAIVGKLVGKSSQYEPAIAGSNSGSPGSGVGVEGLGNYIGVYGVSNDGGYGVIGFSTAGNDGTGVFGKSSEGPGVQAISNSGDGLDASSTYGAGVMGHSVNAYGVAGISEHNFGVFGQSTNHAGVNGLDLGSGTGVFGSSVSGIGVYGFSSAGYAGYFEGTVAAKSYVSLSDRNAKTDFAQVDSAAVLERISALPITSWTFKNESKLRHIGPTAQDFHVAFGLNGEDDTHINLADSAGVSLAAIQELNKRLQEKDARIAALERQLESLNDTVSARLTKLEKQLAAAAH